MINFEAPNENLESQFWEKSYDIFDYIEEKYYEYQNIFKIILLCFCFVIIIIPSSKKNIDNRTNPITLPDQKNEPVSKEVKVKNQGNGEENKKNQGNNKEQGRKQQDKEESNKKPEDKEESNLNEGNNINEQNNDNKDNSNYVNLYIATHKDFNNSAIFNPNYKILVDERSQLKKEYKLEIIPTNDPDNILYPKRIAYGECSKIYKIWNLYKSGNITSKYVGFFHYSKIFQFTNNIPDLDSIFQKFDAILIKRYIFAHSPYPILFGYKILPGTFVGIISNLYSFFS